MQLSITRTVSARAAPVRASRKVAVAAPRPMRNVRVSSSSGGSEGTSDAAAKLQESAEKALDWVKDKWETTADSEKPAAVAIIIGVVVAQIAIGATIDAVDKIPIIKETLELLGIAVTGVFAYRYLTDPDERESVKKSIDAFVSSVTGGSK